MYRIALSLLLGIIASNTGNSQSLYMPRDVKQAIHKGTRSLDGRPGKNYWQNKGSYSIVINAAPPDRTITGTEKITYVNNSPDTLANLVIKLILNIHKPGAVRYGSSDSAYLTKGIIIDKYTENGQSKPWGSNDADGTWRDLKLGQAILPHDSIQLTFDWHYQVSTEAGREGMIDPTTYFLGYFYPRVAVYDDYSGWDRMDFTDLQEFYNDFNEYTLQVNVPANFIVWSTGILQNPKQVLKPAVAQKLAESFTTDSILHIATKEDLTAKQITVQSSVNSWIWKAANVSDMALGISDHYLWDASSVVVDPKTGRRASVQAAYNDAAQDFHQMVSFGRHALDWFSNNWPGVAYPFPKTTIFQGTADMEYPMMVNDNTTNDWKFSRFVAEHEIAHTWFPFYMGINETRYAFMDEGWATTFEILIGRNDLGNEKAESVYKQFRINEYTYDPSAEEDLPIITPANLLHGVAYGNNAYGKPSLAYLAVKDLLGDDLFRKCLHGYMDRWNGKHPIPWDFFYSFNDISGKDLNWFWKNWFFSNHYIDLAIEKVESSNTKYTVNIRNVGGFAIPFDLVVRYKDGSFKKLHQTPGVWSNNENAIKVEFTPETGKQVLSVQLDGGIYVDATHADNIWTAH